MRVVWALLVVVAGLAGLPGQAMERPVPRPTAERSDVRPVARPTTPQKQVVLIRPTPRPVQDDATPLIEDVKTAVLAQTARVALSEAFPGVEVTRAATVDRDTPLFQDPALAVPLPTLRPANLVDVMSSRGGVSVPDLSAIRRSVRPMPRVTDADRTLRLVRAAMAAPHPRVDTDGSLLQSARPALRPQVQLVLGRRLQTGRSGGGICERGSIQGERIAPVPGRGACGIPNAVRVTQVSGVALSRAARMDCGTARALDDWVRKGVLPAVGNHGGGAVRLEVAAGYACRTRNNQPGARISEHGKGRAIDISGIRLANGETISVLRDWGRGTGGRMLRTMWRAACGPFGTVLGPNSDRFHRDHFHFDTARYRSGSYCR